ncbi:MAG: hypothetical protein GWP91_23345 [Rhodobacterales bacterium]|nr:hypothetical protein [Rhodobacterales bacterium]
MMWISLALLLAMAPIAGSQEIRGVTVSCPTSGWEWGSDDMVRTLDELEQLGVTWVTIHPYAQIQGDGSVGFKPVDPNNPPEWLARPIREAHKRGQKVMIKPHLAYWGSSFSWRGEIQFKDPIKRAKFFTEYHAWITNLAAASRGADAFVVGVELGGTTQHEAEWRSIIQDVRAVYSGPLTYGANWDKYAKVPFWDALDTIGIQAYFPLIQAGQSTDRVQLDAGWKRVMAELAAYAKQHDRHIVFTELGYPRRPDAAARPWEAGDNASHEALQVACLDAAMDAIEGEAWVIGAFLWKWFPGDKMPRDFALQQPAARAVISEHWTTRP